MTIIKSFDLFGCVDNLITNPGFDTDLSGWTSTPAGGWVWSAGTATYQNVDEGAYLSQDILTEYCEYSISFDTTASTSTSLWIYAGTNEYGPITVSSAVTLNLLCTGGTEFSIYVIDEENATYIDGVCVELITCFCPEENYCITNTGYDFDGNYSLSGSQYNGYSVYYNSSYYIYFSSTYNQWCLSSSIEGSCLLFGKYPSNDYCPDLSEDYLIPTLCPTPTPTPTINCNILNFEAIFDCFVTPTPSITPTNTVTPTVTPTPSSTPFCQLIDVNASMTAYTPTPTPTNTPTPSSTTPFSANCSLTGNVTFNVVNSNIQCPVSYIFEDCIDGNTYGTVVYLSPPSGGTLTSNMVFNANVNGQIRCIKYIGTQDISSNNSTIQLLSGPYSNVGNCSSCLLIPLTPTPTPTNTSTPTPTPTLTPTPTATSLGTSSGRFDIYVDIQSGLTPLNGSVWYSVDNFIDNLQPYPTSFTWTELSNGIYDTCGTNTFVGSIYVSIGDNVYLQVRDDSNTIIYKHKAGFLVPSVFDPCNNPLVSNDYFTSISSYGGPYPTTADIKLVVLNPLSTSPTPP